MTQYMHGICAIKCTQTMTTAVETYPYEQIISTWGSIDTKLPFWLF